MKDMKTGKQLILIAAFMSVASFVIAATLGVSLDGSQPFSSIQSAVDASAHGDTVLVYPGRYIENVDYNGKNITIASLELTTGNPAYRDSTIVDGNRSGSAIKSILDVNDAGIYGLTLTNGSGSPLTYYNGAPVNIGGGIVIFNALAFELANCKIEGNIAFEGGGIFVYQGTIQASGTQIRDNFATAGGGGILIHYYGQVIFNQEIRCSVYNNTAGYCQDIIAADSRLETSIYLDMGTLCPTSNYYIYYSKSVPDWPGGFPVVDIQRGYRSEVNHDLYVSPHGNDDNDGLSISTPLKRIYKALQMVASDSLNPKTIHLARGVYSTDDGQFFPVNLKPHVFLIGDSLLYPVLENLEYQFTVNVSSATGCRVENLEIEFGDNNTFPSAIGGGKFTDVIVRNIIINPFSSVSVECVSFGTNNYYPTDYTLENITIRGQNSNYQSGFYNNMPDAVIRNLTIDGCHNTGDEFDGPMPIFYFYGNKLTLENSKIINNTMAYEDTPVVSIGAAHFDSDSRLIMNNVLIANNHSGGYVPVFIAAYTDSTSVISNCTFANNSGSNIANILNGNLRVANCIFDNDLPVEILCQGTYPNTVSVVDFENNFIRGYPDSFATSAVNDITFNDVVLTGDPGFCSSNAADFMSYRLGNNSICREAGTPDTTGLFLPELDLYGNQRVFGTAIDIGCNEWNYPVALQDPFIPAAMPVSVYPNPFSHEISIGYSIAKSSQVEIRIFNLKGQLVRTLYKGSQNKGEHALAWKGFDDSGRNVGAGIYLLQLKLDGKAQKVMKLVKLR